MVEDGDRKDGDWEKKDQIRKKIRIPKPTLGFGLPV
jgi:hypothetical protein